MAEIFAVQAAAGVASGVLQTVISSLWNRTTAYLEMDKDCRHALQELKLNEVYLRSIHGIPTECEAILKDMAMELESLVARIDEKQKNVKASCGLTSMRNVITTWWSASRERNDLLVISSRLSEQIQTMFNIVSNSDAFHSQLLNLLPEKARHMWITEKFPKEMAWATFNRYLDEQARLDHNLQSLLNLNGNVHLTVFFDLVTKIGYPFAAEAVAVEAERSRALRVDLIGSDVVTFSATNVQERLLLAEHLMNVDKEWVALEADYRLLLDYTNSLMNIVKRFPMEYNWADIWALYLRKDFDKPLDAIQEELIRLFESLCSEKELTKFIAGTAKKVNDARHKCLHLLTRYMIFWRLAHVSFDVFVAVDFPGKPRVLNFIKFVEPLDEANLRIVIEGMQQNEGDVWAKGWPDVYLFLRAWLVGVGLDRAKIPANITVGGKRTVDFFLY